MPTLFFTNNFNVIGSNSSKIAGNGFVGDNNEIVKNLSKAKNIEKLAKSKKSDFTKGKN